MIASVPDERESRRGLQEVLGVDVSTTGVKLIRLKRGKEGLIVVNAALMQPMTLPANPDDTGKRDRIELPKGFRVRASAISYTAPRAVVRLLNLPGFPRGGATADQMVREHVGLEKGYRLGYAVSAQARGRSETSLVAVGVPEEEAAGLLAVGNAGSAPPVSVEVSAMAALTAFVRGPASKSGEFPIGLIEAGAEVTCLSIFHRGNPVLLRKFEFGGREILQRVMRQFHVDEDTARSIMADSSFDISNAVQEAVGSFLRQLSISREFVERKVGKPVQEWYLAGGLALVACWEDILSDLVQREVQIWNPLENLYLVPGGWPAELEGQEVRFAAAVGAAIGALEDA